MDNSIIVALVGSGSALAGTLLGGVLSQRSLSQQIKAENMRLQRSERVDAYTKFLTAYTEYMEYAQKVRREKCRDMSDEMSAYHKFSAICATAMLLSSSSVSCELKALLSLASQYAEGRIEALEVGKKYAVVEDLLRRDLCQPSFFKH